MTCLARFQWGFNPYETGRVKLTLLSAKRGAIGFAR